MERFVETRCQGLIPHAWGFTEVELERDLLGIGKFGIRRASGVFPDGTPFRLPDDEPLPPALEIDVQVRDQLVYLAVPLRRAGEAEFERPDATDRMARHQIREWEARDTTSGSGEPAVVEVGALSTRLLLASRGDRRVRDDSDRAHRGSAAGQACAARRQLHADGAACAGGDAPGDVCRGTARAPAPARRRPRWARRGDRARRCRGICRVPDAAGDQPLRAVARALCRYRWRAPGAVLRVVRVDRGRDGDVHDASPSARLPFPVIATIDCASRSSR